MNSRVATLAAAVFAALALAPLHLPAQQPAEASGQRTTLEEITVTARKTAERLLDAPLSISAFTAADIEEKGFKTLEDVARSAPGVQYSQMGGQIPGRFTSAIRFRGMNVNSDSPSLQLGALFIDGIYVLGGTQSIPYDDVERIEVIKGPQAALYGRSTFGGAINYITRNPSTEKYSGKLSLSAANFQENDVSASFEGPLLKDKVAFRLGGRYYSRGRLFTATDGGGLGEESSKSMQLTLFATPIDNLQIKLRGFYDEDEDGPSAGGIVQGVRNDTCTGTTITTQDPKFPTARPVNFVCGQVPENGKAISATRGFNIIDTPTSLMPLRAALNGVPNYLLDNLVNRPNPAAISVPAIDHMGLVRILSRFSASATYDFAGGYQATVQGGINTLKANWIREFGLTVLGNWFSRDPQGSHDRSYEVRLASPTDQRLTWIVGGNKYTQRFLQSGSGGDSVNFCFAAAARPLFSPCTGVTNLGVNTLLQNSDEVTNYGMFAVVNFKITDAITASAEGRKQKDTTKSAILSAMPLTLEEKTSVPRAILRWTPSTRTNVYASWAKGLLPGTVNSQVASATPRELAQYMAIDPTLQPTVAGDRLKMWELGWKQQWLDSRAQTSLAYYNGKWTNQKGRATFIIQEDCGSPSHGPGSASNAGNGCPNGPTGLPAVLNGVPYVNSRNANVAGNSKIWGVEAEGSILLTDNWDLGGNITWARSEYDYFIFNYVQAIAGFNQMKGRQNARFPKWSGSVSSGYTRKLEGSDWTLFVNGSASYTGKTFVDESNLSYCGAYWLANVRAGGEKGGIRIEGFVKNLTDEKQWAACARWTDFDTAPSLAQLTTYQGIAVQAQTPRQYGIRAVVKF